MSYQKRKERMINGFRPFAFMTPGMIILTIGFFIPMSILFTTSFYKMVPGSSAILKEFTIENYLRFFDPYYLEVLFTTMRIALFTTVLSLLLGYPVAYFIKKCNGGMKTAITIIVLTPLLTNVVARTLGTMIFFGRHGPVNNFLEFLNISPIQFVPSELGIVIGLTQVFIPYMILSISSVLENIDFSLGDAARDMGMSSFGVFRKIIFPLSLPGVIAGSLFVFLLSFSSYVTPRLLGGGMVMTITMLIYQQTMQVLNWPFGAAVSIILLIVSIFLVTLYTKFTSRGNLFEKTLNEDSTIVNKKKGGGDGFIQDFLYNITASAGRLWDRIKENIVIGSIERCSTVLGRFLLGFLIFISLFLIVLPLPMVVLSSFSNSSMITFPPEALSFRWYTGILERTEYIRSFLLSLRLAFISMIISVSVGTCAALGLTRYSFKGKEIIRSLFLSPLMLPAVILGIAFLRFLVILRMVGSFRGLLIAHMVLTTAYVVRTISSNLSGFDYSLEEAARDMGAGSFLTFRKITFPLIKPGLIIASIFAFIVSFDETTLSIFITGGRTITLPVRIFSQLEYGLDPTVTAISSLLIVMVVIIVGIIGKVFGLDKIKIK